MMLIRIKTIISIPLLEQWKGDVKDRLKREFAREFAKKILNFFEPKYIVNHDDFLQNIKVFETSFHVISNEDYAEAMRKFQQIILSYKGKDQKRIQDIVKLLSKDYDENGNK